MDGDMLLNEMRGFHPTRNPSTGWCKLAPAVPFPPVVIFCTRVSARMQPSLALRDASGKAGRTMSCAPGLVPLRAHDRAVGHGDLELAAGEVPIERVPVVYPHAVRAQDAPGMRARRARRARLAAETTRSDSHRSVNIRRLTLQQ